jgi:phosphatidylethanolamine/phosphatidyl-N-methylethanolamine N-methyltransferase
MNNNLRFLRAFLRRPMTTGAIAPSSRSLAARMVEDMGLREARTVVELGPGTGCFTRAILDEIGPETLFLAVEVNPEFARHLRAELPSRVQVINDSIEHLAEHLSAHGRPAADCILSGIPWAGFSGPLQERLLGAVASALRPGGRFATFAYIHAASLPSARRFRRLLEARYREVQTTPVVWRNLPPAFVYRCEK